MATDTRDGNGRFTRTPATAEREAAAMRLRARGASYAAIADQLGYCDRSAARKAVQRGLNATVAEPAAELRDLELARLDDLHATAWKVMRAPHVLVSGGQVVEREGEPLRDDMPVLRAIDTILRIMVRRARLLGLDIAAPAEVGGTLTYVIVGVGADGL